MFTRKTLDFLAENRLRDSKEWFDSHKNDYKRYVSQPLQELAKRLSPVVKEIDPLIAGEPKACISRIHRDTRFSKDKSRYRDVMWCSFGRGGKQDREFPGFFFELSPAGFRYGTGFCQPSPSSMESARRLILNNAQEFREAFSSYKRQDKFELTGEFYKRSKSQDAPEEIKNWLDRKNLNFVYQSGDFSELFSEGLAEDVAAGFMALRPEYLFLVRAEELNEKRSGLE